MTEIESLFAPLKRLHSEIRDRVVAVCESSSIDQLSEVVSDGDGDTIFAVDRVSETVLLEFFESEIASKVPVVLIAEGIEHGKVVLPRDASEIDAVWRIIVDPIDGTRGLMYQKRSGWILTGVAPNKGETTRLTDIEFAIQTEIPLVKQYLSDSLWAFRGKGAKAERYDRITGETRELHLKPSSARSIEQGFAMISRFFPGVRDLLAEIDDEIVRNVLGTPKTGKAQCFEDQYVSSGGQLYELIAGHDRFVADLRPFMMLEMKRRGMEMNICCHPYDLCTELIAREMGVEITDVKGGCLNASLSLDADVAWAGYANSAIRAQIEPAVLNALRQRSLID